MKQIFSSDWLLKWATWTHLALFHPTQEKNRLEWTYKVCNIWTMLVLELQKVAEVSQNKVNINNPCNFTAP